MQVNLNSHSMNPPFVIVEQEYYVTPGRLWSALTDADQIGQWYFGLPGFKAEVGYEFQFTGGTEENQYLHRCRITEVIPEQKLSHTWRYEGYDGDSLVSFELSDVGADKTRLKLTHAGLETFPPIPDFAAANFQQGWNQIIGTNLKEFVEASS